LSLFSFYAARAEKKVCFYYLWGFFLGLAVMTRQLPGFFICPVILAYLFIKREFDIFKNPHFYGAVLLSAAVILPWHIIMYLKYQMGFINQYFGVTFITAFKGYPLEYAGNASLNPWYAYYQILLSNYEPWLIFFLIGLYNVVKNFKTYAEDRRSNIIFVLCWCFVPLALFQAAKVKQYHYLMPLYIPITIIAATALGNFGESLRLKFAAGLAIITALLTICYVAYPVIPKTLDSREYVELMKMVPDLKKIDGDVYAVRHGFSYFNNCFRFYADKKTVLCTEDEMAALANSPQKHIFVLLKEDFPDVFKRITRPITIVKDVKDSVLFTN
jgi:4-amino-4-deoxy-L-arabinose transferase-like glycosyltransferase